MSKNNFRIDNTAKTAFIIMLLSIVGRSLGLVRESILASRFGASFETDAYKIVFSIPTMILVTLSASTATTLIPVYTDIIKHKSRETAEYYINNLINIVALISVAITALGMVFAPALIKIIAPGFHKDVYDLTVNLSLIIMPSIIFYALTDISEGFLQANKIFAITVFTAVPFNLFIIAGILFPRHNSIEAVAIGSLLAVASQFLILIPFMRRSGFRYRMYINFKEEGIKKTFFLMIPVFISSTFSQAYIFINRMLASALAMGSISALDYADKASNILYNIVISPIIMVIYPKLSFLHDNLQRFCYHITATLKAVIFITLPTAAILLVLRVPVTAILYERGIFSRQDTLTTSVALACFSLGLPGICIKGLMIKAFYSMKDTHTPMTIDIFTVILNTVLSFFLVKYFGIGGLALSLSIASTAGGVILLIRLQKKVPLLKIFETAKAFLKALAASSLTGVLTLFIYNWSFNAFYDRLSFIVKLLFLAIIISAGIITYIGLLYVLKVKELDFLLTFLRKIIDRLKKILFLHH